MTQEVMDLITTASDALNAATKSLTTMVTAVSRNADVLSANQDTLMQGLQSVQAAQSGINAAIAALQSTTYDFHDVTGASQIWGKWANGSVAPIQVLALDSGAAMVGRALAIDGTVRTVLDSLDALENPPATVTPTDINRLAIEATNDTTLKIKYLGSDGVVRSVSLVLG